MIIKTVILNRLAIKNILVTYNTIAIPARMAALRYDFFFWALRFLLCWLFMNVAEKTGIIIRATNREDVKTMQGKWWKRRSFLTKFHRKVREGRREKIIVPLPLIPSHQGRGNMTFANSSTLFICLCCLCALCGCYSQIPFLSGRVS